MVRAGGLGVLLGVCLTAAGMPPDPPSGAGPGPGAGVSRPRSAARVVRTFDFDERAVNPFPVPRYWRRAQGDSAGAYGRARPGFPMWNQAALDYPERNSPSGSLKLPAAGGSTCLRLEPGVIAVFPGADYMVSARVRTAGLMHARARLVARFLDRSNAPIAASETATELVGDQPEWRAVSALLPGDHADAAFLQLDLEVLQPEQFRRAELGRHQVWPEDFDGAAWFDDVAVAQLPRIELTTSTGSNVVVAPARPEIRGVVRDLTGEAIRARITLYDVDGRAIDRLERPITPSESGVVWSPDVRAYGWYRATLEVLSPSGGVGAASTDLVWLPPRDAGGSLPDRARLGIGLEHLPADGVTPTLDLLLASGVGSVALPAWSDGVTPETCVDGAHLMEPLVDGLRRRAVEVTFTLPRVPALLAAATRTAPDEPLEVFAREPVLWAPYLVPFLDKYGQSVRHWQLGVRADPRPRHPREAAARVDAARRFLASLVPGPVVTIPWPSEAALGDGALSFPGAPDGVAMVVDYTTSDDAVGRLAADWSERQSDARLCMTLGTLPGAEFSARDAAIDLTRRAVLFWAGATAGASEAPPSASILQPWRWSDDRRPRPLPSALYAVWSNLAARLTGRRFAGEVPLAPGVRCILMAPAHERAGGGLLVAWRESAPPGEAAIHAFLGPGAITSYDPFGNATPVPVDGSGAPAHHVPVTDTPVFVEGVDVGLARFIASLGLEPGFFASGGGPYEAEVVFTNPWPEPIAGRIHIAEPGGLAGPTPDRSWQISPRRIEFALGAGQAARLPIRVAFSTVEEAGVKPFVVDAELDGRDEYGPIRLRTALEVGLGALRLDLTYRFGPGPAGPDLIVEAQVGNNGDGPVTLELAAFAPPGTDYPRSRASISDLPPGETVIRRFAYPGGAAALRGQRILVSVQDTGADARINRSVTVE